MFYHKMACSLCQGFYIKFKILNQFMMRRGMNIKRESRFLATEHFFGRFYYNWVRQTKLTNCLLKFVFVWSILYQTKFIHEKCINALNTSVSSCSSF